MASFGQWALVAEVNCADPRVELGSLAVTAGGSPDRTAWDFGISSNVWRDPEKRWVMPAPLPTTAAWTSTVAGDYARLTKTDYTLTTAAAWIENPRDLAGNIYLEGNGTNERVTTATTYSADQAWYFSVYVPGLSGLHDQSILYAGFGTFAGSSTISLRVRANGGIAVYKGSTQVGYADLDFAASKAPAGKALAQSTVNIMVIPIRPYERDGVTLSSRGQLLIVTDGGTSTAVEFEGLGSSDTITPSGVMWWQVPQGRPSVQAAKLNFEATATLYGPAQKLRYAPNSPRTFTYTNWAAKLAGSSATATSSLVVASSLAAYTPNGTTDTVRVKVALSGPIALAAVDAYMGPKTTTTADDPVDILAGIKSLSIAVDDWRQGGRTSVSLTGHYAKLEDAGMVGLATQLEWPFRLAVKDMEATTPTKIDIFRGVLCIDADTHAEGLAHGIADLLSFTGKDWSYELEMGSILDPLAYDGQEPPDTAKAILLEAGFAASYVSASSTTYTIPVDDPPQGQWTEIPERGAGLWDTLQGIFDRHMADWWRGWVPTTSGYTYRLISPSDLVNTVVATLYASRADAAAASVAAADRPYRIYHTYSLTPIPPEANQVIVIGQTRSGDRRLILSQSNIAAAQDPTTLPASRPNTWTGRVERVIEVNPGVTTQAQANDLRDALAARLAVTRNMVEFEAPFLITTDKSRPVWSGDVVRVYTAGRAAYDDVRILAIPRIDFGILEHTSADVDAGSVPIRKAVYRGEIIATGP